MREHSQILVEAGGPSAVALKLLVPPGNVKQWRRSNSIPAPYWKAMVDHGFATLEELASSAAKRRASTLDSEAA